MIDSETIKKLLFSILDKGDRSPLFNQFYEVCIRFSVATLYLNKNQNTRNDLQRKMDCSVQDLACDCIWKLFIPKQGRLIEFEKYFNKHFPDGIETIHPDNLKAQLAILIKARTNQGLSLIKEEWGDIYFDIRKAVSTEVARRKETYKKHIIHGIKYLSFNHKDQIDFSLPQVEKNYLLSRLFPVKMKKYDYAKVLRIVFEILSSQQEYCKAVEEKLLLDTLKEFYYTKASEFIELNNSVENTNVEYIVDEDNFDQDS